MYKRQAFYKLGRYSDALQDAKDALRVLSDDKPQGLRTGEGEICHQRLGMAALQLKDYKTAKSALEQAAQLAILNHRSDKKLLEWIKECDTALGLGAPSKPATTPAKEQLKPASNPSALQPISSANISTCNNKQPTMPKYQYYQSDKFMTISILESNVQREDLILTLEEKHITVQLRKGGVEFTVICGPLYAEIDVDLSKVVIKEEKVLVKLKKVEAFEWQELFGKTALGEAPPKRSRPMAESSKPAVETKARPYASDKDWNAIERDVEEEERKEKPEGDEAMNKLFQQIYANSSEETKRAMIKSYQTSCLLYTSPSPRD